MYGIGRLQQRTTCDCNQFQTYDNIAEKGSAGGLNHVIKVSSTKPIINFRYIMHVMVS